MLWSDRCGAAVWYSASPNPSRVTGSIDHPSFSAVTTAHRESALGQVASGGHGSPRQRRIVGSARHPKPVQQDAELPGHGDDGALLGRRPTALRDAQAVAAQGVIGTARPENVVCGLHERLPYERAAGLRDGEFGMAFTRCALPRCRRPRYAPTLRLEGKRWGLSIVSTNASAVTGPTPGTCRSRPAAG
jgi:hypothetical protein